jgi:aspartate dehydrogenase
MALIIEPLRVGFIGYGTAACQVESGIRGGVAGSARLHAVLVRTARTTAPDDVLCTTDRDRFLAEPLDVVVEVAGQEAVRQHGEAVLLAGKDLLVLSIGALADDDLSDRLARATTRGGSHLLLPSGAIGGLDALSSAAVGGLDEVTLTTRKPPDALQTGTARDSALSDAASKAVLLFEGAARDAVREFPANVNVAAALSLAGIGFDRTRVRIYADPAVSRNTHEVHARGWFGELTFRIQNVPTENPKTGRITALSVLKTLRDLRAPVRLVG